MRTPAYPNCEGLVMYSRDDAKTRAIKLRTILKGLGHDITHAKALETIAQLNDFKDWNTCASALDLRAELLAPPKGWYLTGDQAEQYDFGTDPSITRHGMHPAIIRRKANAPKDVSGFAAMVQTFDATHYRGARTQLSAEIKCENNEGAVTLWMRADSKNGRHVAFDNLESYGIGSAAGPITGSTDWSRRTIVLDIPENAHLLFIGYYIRGTGAGYVGGFSLARVSDAIPVTGSESGLHSEPTNMILDIK